jgi:F-type H+-transporting ATPase subunit b
MLINWFTVAAQVINFLVLMWLLKRFLYAPVLRAIDARETGIAARLAEAETKQKEAQAERDDFHQKTEAFDQQRDALLQKATQDAAAEKDRLVAAARKDADALHSQWQDALQNEQHSLGEEITRRTQKGVFEIARKILAELATADLEGSMSSVFITRLHDLSGAEHDQLAASLKASSRTAVVRSAFDLPPAKRKAIQTAVSDLLAAPAHLHFVTAPELVSGIELTTDGQKVAWNISDLLGTLAKSVDELLEEKSAAVKKKATPPVNPDAKVKPDDEVKHDEVKHKAKARAKPELSPEGSPASAVGAGQ